MIARGGEKVHHFLVSVYTITEKYKKIFRGASLIIVLSKRLAPVVSL
ncbi:hypothetical protein Rostam_gp60 [Salmonella phage SE-SHZ-R]|nr:hypothetical protein Rostam_gp60 [Salmonella phage SE-SHZ-R]